MGRTVKEGKARPQQPVCYTREASMARVTYPLGTQDNCYTSGGEEADRGGGRDEARPLWGLKRAVARW